MTRTGAFGFAGAAVAAACAYGCGDGDGFTPPAPYACAPAPSSQGGFCDATALTGITRRVTSNPLDVSSGGVVVADFDGDGDLDLFTTGLRVEAALYRNEGDWGFTDATAQAGLSALTNSVGASAADLDGDGDQDLVVSDITAGARLFENDGTGAFSERDPFATGDGHDGTSVAIGDYDGDGDLDVYTGAWVDTTAPVRVAAPNLLYRNDGGLAFTEVADALGVSGGDDSYTLATAFTDLNGDGALDLYVSNDFGMLERPNLHFAGDGAGGFTAAGADAAGNAAVFAMSVTPGDYDGDGDIDIYVTNIGDNLLLRNDGTGQLEDVSDTAGVAAYGYEADDEEFDPGYSYDPESPDPNERKLAAWAAQYMHVEDRAGVHMATGWGALWLDYDLDGVLDLYVCNGRLGGFHAAEGRHQPNMMFRGLGDGTFEDTSYDVGAADRGDARGCASGDLDGDGDLDLVIANSGWDGDPTGGAFTLLRNDSAGGHFVRVHLVGVASNPDGIGARVQLAAGGATMTREVSGGDGFLSASQRDPVFGLGDATSADELVVSWPSGAVDRVTAPAIDTTVTVVEGSSPE